MHVLPGMPRWAAGRLAGFAAAVGGLAALTTGLAPPLDERHVLAVALVFLLFTLVVSAVWGYAIGLSTAVLADLAVNFFFIPPLHRFTVYGADNAVALMVFLAVAVVGASMLALLRRQVALASAREAEANVLLNLSQAVAHATSAQQAMDALCNVAARALGAAGCAIVQEQEGWKVRATTIDHASAAAFTRDEAALAAEALRTGEVARLRGARRASRRQGAVALTIIPVRSRDPARVVLRILGEIRAPAVADPMRLLVAFANEAGLALQRAELLADAQRAEALKRADEFKSVLLSSVSHDLRSPLTAIKAAVDNLRDDSVQWSDEDTRAFEDTIDIQTELLTRTVDHLLEMSRLEGGAIEAAIEPIEVAPLLADVVQATGRAVEGRAVRMEAAPRLWVSADYGLLMQVLNNLVQNAASYSTPGGAICLSAERVGSTVRVAVADEGPGIRQDDLPHIFEKFYRGGGSKQVKGTGLGLAIVAEMVKLCRGTIAVQSSERGTAFTVTLSLAAPPR